ncbi:GTPase HflX [Fusobacterium sp.]|jgi:GTP-binding protein HflX|uniref:GTPase HflX n=1 Tax=Fusobacterium sp. TaxID=68766 RepID=UPI0015A644CA|nr:GTPase HflX [Fusobacterium sp.]MBS5790729.1 GTPase HflX [Fusobacterium sp.]
MIKGNVDGIKDFILKELDSIYDITVTKNRVIEPEIIALIASISSRINREINVAIDRRGNIVEISIGDSSSVQLPLLNVQEKRLSGIRVIHTHPNGNPNLSSIDISALTKLKLDCIAAIGVVEEKITGVVMGFCNVDGDELSHEVTEVMNIPEFIDYDFLYRIEEIESILKKRNIVENDDEYAILVGIDNDESLDELAELARACNVKVVGKFFQKKSKIDPCYFIGTGKVIELARFKQIKKANLIIFDEELSGLQVKNLEEVTGCKVIDRTVLILEIFATRARTREAKIQVELAQLKYRSSRLLGFGTTMSRTGGGVGTKGPGEKKLEIDKRRIRETIHDLKQELEKIRKTRITQREKRDESGIPKISLVGYTNVGKSTLRNLLVSMYTADNTSKKEDVFAENMLFATLDITTRAITLPDKRVASLTDTVGFVRKLPHDLVEAFKSTLEEVSFSDLIIHVVDISSDTVVEQIKAVENVLSELNALDKPTFLALNKCEMATPEQIANVKEKFSNYQMIEISAKQNYNIDKFLDMTVSLLPQTTRKCTYLIPYTDTSMGAYLHRNAIIQSEDYEGEGVRIVAIVNDEVYNRCRKFMVEETLC